MGGFNFNPSGFYSDDPEDFAGFSPEDFADEGANNRKKRDPEKNYDNTGYSAAEIQHLQEIASRPSPSEAMYQEHLEKRPLREPVSTGRKIAGGLAAAFGEERLSRDIIESPYRQKRQAWEDEGRFLPGRARSADLDASRKLGIERFGITQGAIERNRQVAAQRAERTAKATEENRRKVDEDRDINRKLIDEDRDAARHDRNVQTGILNETRKGTEELRNNANRRADEELAARNEERDLKGNQRRVTEIKKKVRDELTSDPHFSDSFAIGDNGEYILNPKLSQEDKKSLVDFIKMREKRTLEAAGLSDIYDAGEF